MAVRQHLRELEGEGDVSSTDVSSGKGAGCSVERSRREQRHFEDRHRELVMVRRVARVSVQMILERC